MTTSRKRAGGLLLVAALALLLTGCGAGGFGSKEPETLTTKIKSYVALGDGFAAAPYVGTSSDTTGCLRSQENYPQQVAETLGVTSFKDVSCAGATSSAITDPFKPKGAKKKLKAQINALGKDTELVTIGIGIEDDDLLGRMFRICSITPCGTKVLPKVVVAALKSIAKDLPATIRAISERAPQAYVVVVGYPELLPFDEGCKDVPKMDSDQYSYASFVWENFSTTVGSSARQAGAAYVDVRKLTEDHAPCSKDPWTNNFKTVAGERLAYHPVAAEQKAVADAIAAQVKAR